MLKVRCNHATGNKLKLYWNDIAVKDEEREKYWKMEWVRATAELKKFKAATKYAEAQAQQKIDDLILDNDLMKTMLQLRDLQLKKAIKGTN